jgi:hypothetical protein
MPDQVIDPTMARVVQADAAKLHILFAWIVQHDPPEHPDKFIARLATAHPTVYIMVADTLAELQAMLPEGLVRSERQPSDPSEVVEVWFSTAVQSVRTSLPAAVVRATA